MSSKSQQAQIYNYGLLLKLVFLILYYCQSILSQEGDETITLTVKATEPTIPVMETSDGRQGKEETRYITFEPTAPEPSVFEVPESCKTPPTKRN